MALTTAPLMSLDASGTIAKTLVFSKWKGRNYVRQHVIPSNPQSPLQVADRASLAFLSQDWKNILTADQDSWKALAEASKFSPFNAYLKANQKAFANFDPPSQATPAAKTSTPPSVTSLSNSIDNKLVTLSALFAIGSGQWGALFCLSDTTFVNCTRGLVVKMVPGTVSTLSVIVGPLRPGTYFYNARSFGVDGVWGIDGTTDTFTVT